MLVLILKYHPSMVSKVTGSTDKTLTEYLLALGEQQILLPRLDFVQIALNQTPPSYAASLPNRPRFEDE